MKISKHKGNTSWAEGINYGTWDTNAFIMFRERYGHEINPYAQSYLRYLSQYLQFGGSSEIVAMFVKMTVQCVSFDFTKGGEREEDEEEGEREE